MNFLIIKKIFAEYLKKTSKETVLLQEILKIIFKSPKKEVRKDRMKKLKNFTTGNTEKYFPKKRGSKGQNKKIEKFNYVFCYHFFFLKSYTILHRRKRNSLMSSHCESLKSYLHTVRFHAGGA